MSTTNGGHPGLSFGGGMNNGIRQGRAAAQGYPPQPPTKTVNTAVLPQHSAPFQHFPSHQAQSSTFSQLFSAPSNPSPVHNAVQNGGSRPQQAQAQLPVPSSRSRGTPQHRQMTPQPNGNPLGYIPTTMPQQHLAAQPINQAPMNQQPMGQQPLGQPAMNQQQALNQQAISQQAINHQQAMSQDSSIMSQSPASHPHPAVTPQPPAQTQPKTPQPPPQAQQQPLHADASAQLSEHQTDETMEMESQTEAGDGEDGGADGKNPDNGTPYSENPAVPLLPRDIYNARAAISRNPAKVTDGLAEDRPAIYSKPRPSAQERIITDLRKEIAKVNEELEQLKQGNQKKIEELEEKVRDKDKQIKKYEMFVDICNERVMFQREKLKGLDDNSSAGNGS
ncbi:hypothetical protein M406DRAFT_106539 [Cryphonectria parasitica EP155]|uniref:Uncharacterized protein n=1 Tax=Cryphonectria parasitica (strain ATCC 38755 / EP155) TaxID=660469 RepID=A0A9P5CRB5_CRYP1|nr:uncharacterized protein M406DRAFT_106539 [Cryphonectria parasitica EP155]KAF3767357.1 hypothetical protein M406DRAFT_106539 [Cryphonectria parasitica EP155]